MAVLTSLATDTPSRLPGSEPRRAAGPGRADHAAAGQEAGGRPPSAQAVVEAIKSIERELLAQRQNAELSAATPLPASGVHRKPARA